MRWDAFESACPEDRDARALAVPCRRLVLVGTLRRDGSPRISPNEPAFGAGRFFVSMMWRSRKVLDVLRDPRVTVHSVASDRENLEGDLKLYGRLIDEQDSEVRQAFRAGLIRLVRDPVALAWDLRSGFRILALPT